MAYVYEEEEKDKNGNPKNSSGYLSKPGSNNGQVSGNPTTSGRWTNLQKYLDVNRDKSQGMVDNVVGTTKGVDTNLNAATSSFNSAASDVIGGAGDYNAGVNALKGVNVGHDSILQESDNLDKTLKDMENWTDGQIANYSGSTSVQHDLFDPKDSKDLPYSPDYIVNNYIDPAKKQYDRGNANYDSSYLNLTGDTYTKAKDGKNLTGDGLDSSSLRAQALKNIYNKDGRYSTGENSFDNFLSNEVGQDKYKNRNTEISTSLDNADRAINQVAPEAQKARDGIAKDDYKALQTSLNDEINRKATASSTINEKYGRLASMISGAKGRLTPTPVQADVQINNPTAPVSTSAGNVPNPSVVGGPIGSGGSSTSPMEQLVNGVPTSTNELKNRVKIKTKW